MGDQDLQLREELWRALMLPTQKLSSPSFLHVSRDPSLDYRQNIGKNDSFQATFTKYFASVAHFQFHNHDLFEKGSLELNSLVQNSVWENYLPELYPLYSPSYFHLACCPPSHHHV